MKNILIVLIVVLGAYGVWITGTKIGADEISKGNNFAIIQVKVVDSTAKAVESAIVTIRSEDATKSLVTTSTLKNGSVKIQVPAGQNYEVVATSNGKVGSQLVSIGEGQFVKLQLILGDI